MKILSAKQLRQLDLATISNEPISSISLMERASLAFTKRFIETYTNQTIIYIFCGNGNNGGDGLAIGRILSGLSYQVKVYYIQTSEKPSEDFSANLIQLRNHLEPHEIQHPAHFPPLNKDIVCIDALFGTGLSRPIKDITSELINFLNESTCEVVSVDIASGLFVDKPNEPNHTIIKPTYTFTFQVPKLSFMFPANDEFVGHWETVDILLDAQKLEETFTTYYYTDVTSVYQIHKNRPKFSHKGTFGHALVIAGSYGKMGAAILTSKACLRSGVGLLTMLIPSCGYNIAQIAIPEAMVITDSATNNISQLPDISTYSAIAIGPGLGTSTNSCAVLKELLLSTSAPLVIDADALNILAFNQELLSLIPRNTILTPHPKEFERFTQKTANEFERLQIGIEFAKKHGVIICLKGAHTAVILPNGDVHFNSTGNPGMSTGGTGDALTGIIVSLLAQKYEPENAAILGVFLHGKAGDLASAKRSQSAMIASDLIDELR